MATAGADLVDSDEATTVAVLSTVVVTTDGNTAVAADWAGVDDCDVNGGLYEPGHGLSRGPWRWTVPSFRCSCQTAWQTLQTPLVLFAVCNSGQV